MKKRAEELAHAGLIPLQQGMHIQARAEHAGSTRQDQRLHSICRRLMHRDIQRTHQIVIQGIGGRAIEPQLAHRAMIDGLDHFRWAMAAPISAPDRNNSTSKLSVAPI